MTLFSVIFKGVSTWADICDGTVDHDDSDVTHRQHNDCDITGMCKVCKPIFNPSTFIVDNCSYTQVAVSMVPCIIYHLVILLYVWVPRMMIPENQRLLCDCSFADLRQFMHRRSGIVTAFSTSGRPTINVCALYVFS